MTGPTGFEAVAGSIGGLQQQAQGLRAAVDSGKLVMDPETAEKLAKLYENKADKLAFKIGDAERLIVRGAFGDCNIGRQLEAKFVAKVEDGENGVIAILRKSVSRLDLDRCSGQDHRLWLMRCHSGWFPTSSGSWSSR